DKGQDTADLRNARHDVCERHMQGKPYRTVEIQDPERDRGAMNYRPAVTAWHEQRAILYEQLMQDHLSEQECGAFLVWGDPALYDSTLRIIDHVAARGAVQFEWEIIPGISSIQALAARHRISMNEIGEPIHITTGRRLIDEKAGDGATVMVMLDGHCAFKALKNADIDIYWGAYLGTPDEILLSGKLGEIGEEIEHVRAQARQRKGWIMDTYLLRKRVAPSC
ncbi:MAG TPA: precorrin-6A synthase (deacetylating), partial [Steroidobacteraceae bacterium]